MVQLELLEDFKKWFDFIEFEIENVSSLLR